MVTLDKCVGKEIFLNVRNDVDFGYSVIWIRNDRNFHFHSEFANCSTIEQKCFRNTRYFKENEIFETVDYKYLKLIDKLQERMILAIYIEYNFLRIKTRFEDSFIILGITYI